jgi:hypothetical protein
MNRLKKLAGALSLSLLLAAGALAEPRTDAMLQIARDEWITFGKQTYGLDGKLSNKGHQEAEEFYWQKVARFWAIGTDLNWTGKDTDVPWSAAFISYVMRQAGFGENFHYSDSHCDYIHRALDARNSNDQEYAFWAYRLTERAPQLGDMVGYAREQGVDFDHQPPEYKSHCDIVVAVRPGEIDVIGGNVGDSVTLKTLKIDSSGLLVDKTNPWFVVLSNRFCRTQ